MGKLTTTRLERLRMLHGGSPMKESAAMPFAREVGDRPSAIHPLRPRYGHAYPDTRSHAITFLQG